MTTNRQSLLLLVLVVLAVSSVFAQQKSQTNNPAEIDKFVGTWSASHNGTQYFVLELHKENSALTGAIRVCSFSMQGDGENADVTVTNDKLSESLPIRNVVLSGKSIKFDWKDPDGDENHIQFERTAESSGRLKWRDLPAGAKMPAIVLNRQTAKDSIESLRVPD